MRAFCWLKSTKDGKLKLENLGFDLLVIGTRQDCCLPDLMWKNPDADNVLFPERKPARRRLVMAIGFLRNIFPSYCNVGTKMKDVLQNQTWERTVMVVDDDDDFRLILRDRLERMGMQCLEAENGEVARLQLKKFQVDLLITDNHMPKMDGLALIDWLKQTQRYMPIIFVSGDLSGHVREKAEQANVYAILEKPCSLSELSSIVEDVFKDS
jgi:CheY-like chemotaxis protein